MKPPLAYDGPVQKSISVVKPFAMRTRRMGAACDAAQNSPAALQPVFAVVSMLIERLESDRQKFVSATQPSGLH